MCVYIEGCTCAVAVSNCCRYELLPAVKRVRLLGLLALVILSALVVVLSPGTRGYNIYKMPT